MHTALEQDFRLEALANTKVCGLVLKHFDNLLKFVNKDSIKFLGLPTMKQLKLNQNFPVSTAKSNVIILSDYTIVNNGGEKTKSTWWLVIQL